MPGFSSILDWLNPSAAATPGMPVAGGAAGGGVGSLLGQLLDPAAQARQQRVDTLGSLSSAILQASAPRVGGAPVSGLDIFGAGINGAMKASEGSEDRTLKRALTAAQLATAQGNIANDQAFRALLSGGGSSASPAPAAGAAAPLPGTGGDMAPYQSAIAGNESAGQPNGGYGAVGPPANEKGSRAYGKYQVMDFNIGPWTQEVLGKPMTPQEFVANPQAQDAVFNAKFGQYLKQTGNAQDAASMWFSGRTQAQAGGAKDVLGTSVPAYVAKFTQGLPGGGAMPAPPASMMAGGPPAATMPGAPSGLVPPGPAPAPMPGSPGPIAQPPQVAQGDGGGAPAPAAATPAPQVAQGAPQTLQQVIQTIPPGVRQMIGAMGRKEGLPLLLKYADPETTPAIDSQTGQVVFAPKSALGSGRYQPVDAARLSNDSKRLELEQKRAVAEDANRNILPNGQINQSVIDAKRQVSAAQGTDPVGKMLVGDYDDARKHNSSLQSGALVARSGMAQANRLGQLLDGVDTGKFTGTTQDILKAAKGVGINLEALGITDKTDKIEAAQALSGQMALALRDPSQGAGMPGALSDSDRKFLAAMTPGVETTPQGRKLMLEYSGKMYQRQVDLAKIANDFMRSPEAKKDPNALYQKLNDYAEAHPLFSEKDLPAGIAMPSNAPAAPGGGAPPPPPGFKLLGR